VRLNDFWYLFVATISNLLFIVELEKLKDSTCTDGSNNLLSEKLKHFFGEIQLGVVHTMNSCCKLVAAP
jgi:hypothetical protein